jgi:hypothetical protein
MRSWLSCVVAFVEDAAGAGLGLADPFGELPLAHAKRIKQSQRLARADAARVSRRGYALMAETVDWTHDATGRSRQ